MTILAIETASNVCGVALVFGDKVVQEVSINEKYVHAEMLMRQVDTVLEQSHCRFEQVDGIAVSIGPGSFTGLRIGLSVAKGLSFAWDKRLVPVPTLFALARKATDAGVAKDGDHILAALDARRDEVYAQFFEIANGQVSPLADPAGLPVSGLRERAPGGRTWVTGDARTKLAELLADHAREWVFVSSDLAACSAGSVGMLGTMMIERTGFSALSALEPLYIKDVHITRPS